VHIKPEIGQSFDGPWLVFYFYQNGGEEKLLQQLDLFLS